MGTISEARGRMVNLKKNINSIIQDSFDDNKKMMAEINANEQLYEKGEDSKGNFIASTKPYKPRTISIKIAKGQPTDRVTLRDTGKFHRELIVTAFLDYVQITSTVPYAKKLIEKYGNDILGIQQELLKKFVLNYIKPSIQKKIIDRV